jgi:hypothetical protein
VLEILAWKKQGTEFAVEEDISDRGAMSTGLEEGPHGIKSSLVLWHNKVQVS